MSVADAAQPSPCRNLSLPPDVTPSGAGGPLAPRSGKRASVHTLTILWLLAGLIGLGTACDSDTTVPFKRPAAGSADEKATGDSEEDALPPFVAVEFPDGPPQVDLQGAELRRDQGHLHAALVRNVPEFRDVLAVVSGLDQGVRLEQAQRTGSEDEASFGELSRVDALAANEGDCELRSAEIEAPAGAYVVVHNTWSCREPTEVAALGTESTPQPSAPPRAVHTLHIFSNERAPRKLEDLSLLPSADKPAPTLSRITGEDADGDGHEDLQLWLVLDEAGQAQPGERKPEQAAQGQDAPGSGGAGEMAIGLLNRSAGLQVAQTEPENTIATLADKAQQVLSKHPERALELASVARQVQTDYCRGEGVQRISLGGRLGLPCPRSTALGRIDSISLMAHAQLGDVVGAARAYGELRSAATPLQASDQKRVEAALAKLPHTSRFQFVRGPQLSSLPLPPQHRALVAFLDESNLLLRGDPPETFSLLEGTRTPTAMVPPSALLTDPGGRYVITEFVRDCSGDKLRIFRPTQLLAGRTSGAPLAEVLVRPAERTDSCQGRNRARRIPREEMSVLRFGHEELLINIGPQLLHLTLQEPLESSGPARPWTWGRPLPNDPQPDAISLQPPVVPLLTDLGVLLVDARTGQATILDTTSVTGPIRDVALSPSGQQIALVSAEQVWLGRTLLAQ